KAAYEMAAGHEDGEPRQPDLTFPGLYKIYSKFFVNDETKIEFESEIFQDLFDTYGGEKLYTAFREAAKFGVYRLPYVESILKGDPKKKAQRGGSQHGIHGQHHDGAAGTNHAYPFSGQTGRLNRKP